MSLFFQVLPKLLFSLPTSRTSAHWVTLRGTEVISRSGEDSLVGSGALPTKSLRQSPQSVVTLLCPTSPLNTETVSQDSQARRTVRSLFAERKWRGRAPGRCCRGPCALTPMCWKSHDRITLVACFGRTPRLFLEEPSS